MTTPIMTADELRRLRQRLFDNYPISRKAFVRYRKKYNAHRRRVLRHVRRRMEAKLARLQPKVRDRIRWVGHAANRTHLWGPELEPFANRPPNPSWCAWGCS